MEIPSWAKWAASLAIAVALIWVGWRVSAILVTLHVLVCFVLIVVIMLQSGNAADLAGAFGGAGSQTAFGPRGAATFLSRATTWCAIVFMMTSLTLAFKREPTAAGATSTGSILEQTQKSGAAPAKPATPPPPIQIPAPAQQQSAPAQQQSAPAQTPAPAQQPPAKK
jgi:preprotein translocase subunit SecG